MKTFLLDTNVLLSDPNALFSFEKNNIVMPLIVLEELDRHKDRQDETGRNARETIRKLTDLTKKVKDLRNGISLGDHLGVLKVVSSKTLANIDLPKELEATGDNKIIDFYLSYKETYKDERIILVTRDLQLQLKASALEVVWEDYKKLSGAASSSNTLYSGTVTINLTSDRIEEFFDTSMPFYLLESEVDEPLYPNEFVILTNEKEAWGNIKSGVARFCGWNKPLRQLNKEKQGKFTTKNKEQDFAMDLLFDPEVQLVTLSGNAGTGKAQPLDAKILTPTGWMTMGELQIGSKIIGSEGKYTNVIGIYPQGKKDIYKVTFSDGSSTECCKEHLWQTKTRSDNKKVATVKSLATIMDSLKYCGKRNHHIPTVQTVHFFEKPVDIDPYLLGILLGDGCLSGEKAISFSSSDDFIINSVSKLLPKSLSVKYKNGYDYSITKISKAYDVNELLISMRNLNLMGKKSDKKFIPKLYKFNSPKIRLAILQGLMDSDGSVNKKGSSTIFYTTSNKLAEDVQEIVWSFGGKATISNKQTQFTYKGIKKNGLPSFAVHISLPSGIIPFRLPRKLEKFKPRTKYPPIRLIESVEFVGMKEAQCIAVDAKDHLYVTDNYIVTHNTLTALNAGLEQVVGKSKRYKNLVVCRPIQPVGKDVGFLPGTIEEKLEPWISPIKDNLRFLISDGKKGKINEDIMQTYFDNGIIEVEAMTFIRGRSIANAFILIDEAQNLSALEIKTLLTRAGENSKIIITGDISQIDNLHVDSVTNGLSVVIEKFKNQDIAGHVNFVKGVRSQLATLASELL